MEENLLLHKKSLCMVSYYFILARITASLLKVKSGIIATSLHYQFNMLQVILTWMWNLDPDHGLENENRDLEDKMLGEDQWWIA